jgi:hypothetical protein
MDLFAVAVMYSLGGLAMNLLAMQYAWAGSHHQRQSFRRLMLGASFLYALGVLTCIAAVFRQE